MFIVAGKNHLIFFTNSTDFCVRKIHRDEFFDALEDQGVDMDKVLSSPFGGQFGYVPQPGGTKKTMSSVTLHDDELEPITDDEDEILEDKDTIKEININDIGSTQQPLLNVKSNREVPVPFYPKQKTPTAIPTATSPTTSDMKKAASFFSSSTFPTSPSVSSSFSSSSASSSSVLPQELNLSADRLRALTNADVIGFAVIR